MSATPTRLLHDSSWKKTQQCQMVPFGGPERYVFMIRLTVVELASRYCYLGLMDFESECHGVYPLMSWRALMSY